MQPSNPVPTSSVLIFAWWIAIVLSFLTLPNRSLAAESTLPENWATAITPDNTYNFFIFKGDKPVFKTVLLAFGAKWSWGGAPTSKTLATNNELNLTGGVTLNTTKDPLKINLLAKKSGNQTVTYTYELSAGKDIDLTMITTAFEAVGSCTGQVTVTLADGTEKQLPIPIRQSSYSCKAAKLSFQIANVGNVVVNLEPACPIGLEWNALRVMLASEQFKAGTNKVTMTLCFPDAVNFDASAEQTGKYVKSLAGPDWFAFQPKNVNDEGVIGVNNWLDKPAGKHGFLKNVSDHFEFADGTRIKFWGENEHYHGCTPKKADAESTAGKFAKYGVNCVRLHKFGNPGWEGIGDPNDGTRLMPEGLDQMDYFCSQLASNGIYHGFSHSFGYTIRPGNRDRILAYDELVKNCKGSTYGVINFAEDLQDLMIEMVVNLLKHKNPYTGKSHAEDLSLAYIELQNEDDIFTFTIADILKKCPTYKKYLLGRWADWLQAKYSSQADLAAAWGSNLKKEETLEARNIGIEGNPWQMGPGLPGNGTGRQRMLDNAMFLHDVQNQFYSKFVKAIRDTGYKGVLCGSPWQAVEGIPHYYNLRSDDLVGWIDRHNYFGKGIFSTMMLTPGGGLLSSGLQQVSDRPFGVSEWINIYPCATKAEAPSIMAVYGMGLQGWDASYEFVAKLGKGFQDRMGWPPWCVFEADVPTDLGQYPTLARMIYRGDIKEGDLISARCVSLPELHQGKLGFSDTVKQTGDIKEFGGACPPEALAAGRCVVNFTDTPQPSTFPDMTKYLKDKVITSTTRQLIWDYSDKGFFTVNTEGTKAIVGFAEGKDVTLGKVQIGMQSPFASLFVTAINPNDTLANAKTALISAVGRGCNSGFQYFSGDNRVMSDGKTPILLEPVKAKITFAERSIAAVNILDHDGLRTAQTLPVQQGSFTIDGAKDKALYYEVVFQ